MTPTILCVDDEVDNVDALERLFRKKYEVLRATSGIEALELIQGREIAVILSDQRMPNMTGVEFLEKSIETHPDTVRMLLTGYTDIESVIAAINSGQVYRYITKPWDPRDLESAMSRAIERHQMQVELKVKNKELKKAYDELKTLDKAKSQFMILINHELKTPLTSLLSFLELLGESKLDEEQTLYHKKITGSAERLKEIIFDVLEIMNAETGQTKPKFSKIKLSEIASHIENDFKDLLKINKQKIETDFSINEFKSDPEILKSVLRRVVHNAIKFGKKSKPLILTAKNKSKALEIWVHNEGEGLDKKTISHILKPFALDEDIMNHSKGMGLGLSLSQALLKTLGSELKIKSNDKKVSVGFLLRDSDI